MDAALAFITANPAHDLTVANVPDAIGLSQSRLAHLFTGEVGVSVPAYVEARRMEKAEDLLRMTRRPIREVAELVGYRDPLYLSRRFRERKGVSPRGWRGRLAGESSRANGA